MFEDSFIKKQNKKTWIYRFRTQYLWLEENCY